MFKNVLDADDSELNKESVEIAPIGRLAVIVIPTSDIEKVIVDDNYEYIDFRS